jgi:hypothetical protein
MVPTGFDFWLANLNREANSAELSSLSTIDDPRGRPSGSSSIQDSRKETPPLFL